MEICVTNLFFKLYIYFKVYDLSYQNNSILKMQREKESIAPRKDTKKTLWYIIIEIIADANVCDLLMPRSWRSF